MHLEVYYLHSCARTSASWLKDSDVLSGVVQSLRLLSTAAMYQTCETDPILPGPYELSPHVEWAMRSAHNYQWVLSYYTTLCELASVVNTDYSPITYKVRARLHSYLRLLPDELFCPPPFMYGKQHIKGTTDESYRSYYALERAKAGAYRRIAAPFWIKTSRKGHTPPPDQPGNPQEYDLDDDPLADLR